MINSMANQSAPLLASWFVAGWMKNALLILAQTALIVIVSGFVLVERGRTMCDPFFFLPLSAFSAVLAAPIVIESFRRNPQQLAIALLRTGVTRAVASVALILIFSLVLVNAFFWNGEPLLPDTEVCIWAVALSITAASAASAGLALLLSRIPVNAVKWGFRAIALVAFLIYQRLPVAWSISWYELVRDWGVSWMAFAWVMLLASIASAALVLLKRQEAHSFKFAASDHV